jgi:hypothetical protein
VGLLIWGALSVEITGVSFTSVAGPRQRSYFMVRVPRDSWPYSAVSESRPPPPIWRARSPYLHPLGTWCPSYTPGTGFHFRHLLRLAGLRWRYWIPSPHGVTAHSLIFLLIQHLCTDRVENPVTLLQCNCCLAMAWRIPLLRAQPTELAAQKTPFSCCCLRIVA